MKLKFAVFAGCAMCTAAFAGELPSSLQGVPGLYDVVSISNMPGMSGAGGLHFQVCVPQNSASGFAGMMQMGPECQFSHVKISAKTYQADVTCHGALMHLDMSETAPDTRAFSVAMTGLPKIPGVSGPMTVRYTFHRLSASCGDLLEGAMRTPEGKVIHMPKP